MLSTLLKRSARKLVTSRGFAAKEIKFGIEGRAAMLRGVDTLADAVQVRREIVGSLGAGFGTSELVPLGNVQLLPIYQ